MIRSIASERNVGWQDAATAYLEIFQSEAQATLERMANRKMGGGR